MTFGNWPEEIHQTTNQQRRIISTKFPATMPYEISKDSFTGTFFGSQGQLYNVTLDSCTCADFANRKLPCKHIYRLAIECELLDAALKPSNFPTTNLTIGESIEILENHFGDLQICFKNLFSYMIRNEVGIVCLECNRNGKIVKPISGLMLADILPCPFFEYNIASMELVMNKISKKDIMGILKQRGHVPKENLKKEKLITWCVDNVPYLSKDLPQIILLSCSPCFREVLQEAYKYLCRKYEWSTLLVETDAGKDTVFYPSEAVFVNSNICYFPDDEITKLLTEYGHNRCLEGFDITKQGPGK